MRIGPISVLLFLATLYFFVHGMSGWRTHRLQRDSAMARFICELSVVEMVFATVLFVVGAFVVFG